SYRRGSGSASGRAQPPARAGKRRSVIADRAGPRRRVADPERDDHATPGTMMMAARGDQIDEPEPAALLPVRIGATDPVRHRGLQSIVLAAGHRIAAAPDDSDVVLVDGDLAVTEDTPVVALGAAETGQAGLLPRDANPAQIDAALRAATTGLMVRG